MSSAPHNIQAVLFDYGLVLSGPPDPHAWDKMKNLLDSNEMDFHAAYWSPRHDYDRGAFKAPAYWRAVAAALGKEPDEAEMERLIEADVMLWTQPNQEMIDWAARLQRAGVKTGILSNIGDAMEQGVRKKWAWLADFNHHTFSHNLGIAKPELAIYRHAVEGLGVPADQILFIDDRKENIAAAHEAGMRAIQYTDHASFIDAMRSQGYGDLLNL